MPDEFPLETDMPLQTQGGNYRVVVRTEHTPAYADAGAGQRRYATKVEMVSPTGEVSKRQRWDREYATAEAARAGHQQVLDAIVARGVWVEE